MAKAKFQDTLKNGLTGVATVGKKIVDTAGDGAAAAISKGVGGKSIGKVYDIRFSYGTWRDNYTSGCGSG